MHAKDVQIEFNGIVFNPFHTGIEADVNTYIANNLVEGFSSPSITPNVSEFEFSHGAAHGQNSYNRTTVIITGHIFADSQEKQKEMKDALSVALSLPITRDANSDGFLPITITDEIGRTMTNNAKVFQAVGYTKDFGEPTLRSFVFGLEFERNFFLSEEYFDEYLNEEDRFEGMNIGLLYDGTNALDEYEGLELTYDGEGTPFYYYQDPLIFTNSGNYETPIFVEIQEGAINPTIENKTTGVRFTVNYTVLAGEVLVVDGENSSIYVVDSTGVKIDQSGLVDLSSEWVFLTPGENEVYIYDSNTYEKNFLFNAKSKHSFINI